MPGRAEPARKVEEGDHEGLEEPEDGGDAGGEDAGVGDVHLGRC